MNLANASEGECEEVMAEALWYEELTSIEEYLILFFKLSRCFDQELKWKTPVA